MITPEQLKNKKLTAVEEHIIDSLIRNSFNGVRATLYKSVILDECLDMGIGDSGITLLTLNNTYAPHGWNIEETEIEYIFTFK